MSERSFKDYSDEQYPPYAQYLDGHIWPSIAPGGERKQAYVDELAPQHASSAIHKLRRWNSQQWSDEMSTERAWLMIQRRPLYRALAARATGTDDLSDAIDTPAGLSSEQAVHLVARSMFEGAGDHEDPLSIVAMAQRAVTVMYRKGYVIHTRPQ